MSIRFEREVVFCTHLTRQVTRLVEYTTPPNLGADDELTWVRGSTECLQRTSCKNDCPGEAEALQELQTN